MKKSSPNYSVKATSKNRTMNMRKAGKMAKNGIQYLNWLASVPKGETNQSRFCLVGPQSSSGMCSF
jgi:hypothetical protein